MADRAIPIRIAAEILRSFHIGPAWPFSAFFRPKRDGWLPGVSEDVLDALQNPEDAERAVRILNVHSQATDNATRRTFGKRILWITVVWLILVLLVVVAAATKVDLGEKVVFGVTIHFSPFTLSDASLIAIITTTTANVMGLMYVVSNYLFPSKSPNGPPKP